MAASKLLQLKWLLLFLKMNKRISILVIYNLIRNIHLIINFSPISTALFVYASSHCRAPVKKDDCYPSSEFSSKLKSNSLSIS